MTKHPGGRPTKYDPIYCEQVVEHMSEGYSLESFAGKISVAASTVWKWQAEIPEFSEAINVGRAKAAQIWEERLTTLAVTGTGNATATIFALKNRFPDQWRDKQEHEHTGKNGDALIPESKSDLEIARGIAFLLAKAVNEKETNE